MRSRLIDLTGQRFGNLTVLERSENDLWGGVQWLCQCDCCTEVIVARSHLKSGHTKSCGCLRTLIGSIKLHKWNDQVRQLIEKYGLE